MVSQDYDVILLDDLVNRENISTKDQMDKVKMAYRDVLDLLEPHGELIVIGTRWHYDDLYGWIMSKDNDLRGSFDVMVKQAVENGDIENGMVLFPDKYSRSYLRKLRTEKGSSEFSSQYLNNPVDEETATFKRTWFRYYDDNDLRGKIMNRYITVDPAISQLQESDYTAMVCLGVDNFNNWFVLEVIRDRMNPLQIIDKLFALNEKWRPFTIGIETVSFQKTIQYFLQEEMRKRGVFLPITELKPDRRESKEMRIKSIQPRYEVGVVYHPRMGYNIDYLEDELIRFPKGQHDDIIDALSYMNQIAFAPKQKTTQRRIRYGY